jgi:hypothetical protein
MPDMKKTSRVALYAIFVIIVAKIAILAGSFEPEKAIRLNFEGDFPNPEEGTAIFNFRLPMDDIIVDLDNVARYVVFVESRSIPGLFLRYNTKDSVLEGGIPLLRSAKVTLLDDREHQLLYTFKKGEQQKIYLDGEEIASGIFESGRGGMTGFAVFEDSSSSREINVEGDAEFLGSAR